MFFQGKKRLRPISGLRVAPAYLAKTSVIARDVGHGSWKTGGQEDARYYKDLPSKAELQMILLTSIINVPLAFPMRGSNTALLSAIWGAVF